MFMMKSEMVSQPSVVSNDLVQSVGPKNFWETALHNFRTFVWISTNFTHCSLWDYHS
jgi:hypothetical protein